ncbi:hypothetical protein BGZ76_006776 [Entomortierella beljakovae]|nr:hypothetical protein BGZ76_006776 [Entomortierella beljakovae]
MWLRPILNLYYYPSMRDWVGWALIVLIATNILYFIVSVLRAMPLRSGIIKVVFGITLFAAIVSIYIAYTEYKADENRSEDHDKIESIFNCLLGGISLVSQYFLDDDEIKYGTSESEKPINTAESMV